MKRRDFLSIGITAAALTQLPRAAEPARRLTVGAGLASLLDDDEGAPPALTEVRPSWNGQEGAVESVREHAGPRYEITGWRQIGTSG
jgi:hypothetical protein